MQKNWGEEGFFLKQFLFLMFFSIFYFDLTCRDTVSESKKLYPAERVDQTTIRVFLLLLLNYINEISGHSLEIHFLENIFPDMKLAVL